MKVKKLSGKDADILRKLESEEDRILRSLHADAADIGELRSDWQERDSAAERNLREVEWDQYITLRNELAAVVEAKQRLYDGTYGLCRDCGTRIKAKRLAGVPTAKRCIKCQELSERKAGLQTRRASL